MKKRLIKGGRVIDPASGLDRVTDVLIEGELIAQIGDNLSGADEVMDATGLVVVPGLIDMHVHLREPGNEEQETIASGTASATAGGFTTIACMPNTDPPIDSEAAAEFVILQAERAGKANVFPIGTVTKGRAGESLSEMGGLVRGGAVAFSDDGSPVENAELLRLALLYAGMFDKPIISHCEDTDLSGNGVMHAGLTSTILGLPGISSASEEIMVARNIALAGITGGRLHIAHASTVGTVELIRAAKNSSISITAEVTPHHLALTDSLIAQDFDTDLKMNPPLRTDADIEALKAGLIDGTIDAIASDHAPHTQEEKSRPFPEAPFGVIGMESTLPVVVTELVRGGILSLPEAIAKLTINPAKILALDRGRLAVGAVADITIIDTEMRWQIDSNQFASKSRNCPFNGRDVYCRAVRTIVSGKTVYELKPS